MATFGAQAKQIRDVTDQIISISNNLGGVESISRTYISELLLIRLFSMFEIVVEDISCRMVCGVKYCDGTEPSLIRTRPTAGYERARAAMRAFNRPVPHNLLRWSKSTEVRKNLECLFPSTEHFFSTLVAHERVISDIRHTRNHIAHGNRGTRQKFNGVIRNYYGADVNSLTPGRMLISSKFNPPLIEKYCRTARIVLLDSIKST